MHEQFDVFGLALYGVRVWGINARCLENSLWIRLRACHKTDSVTNKPSVLTVRHRDN